MTGWAQWIAKSLLTWVGVIAVLVVVFVVRYQLIQGLLTNVPPTAPGVCRLLPAGFPGVADLAVDPAHNLLLASVGRTGASDPRDGLYSVKLNDPGAAPQKLAGTSANFHPGGISLFRGADGGETLLAVNHLPAGRSMVQSYGVTFDGEAAKLSAEAAWQSGLLISPSGIAAIAPDHFYAANDHAATNAFGRFAEDYLLWPHSDIVLGGGMRFRIAVQRIARPSGVFVKGGFLYVAARDERRLLAFSIEDITGNLTEIGALALPARLGHISADATSHLIVAGESKPGSSQVFRVLLDVNGIPQRYETIFSDDGHVLKGAGSAVVWNNQLFVGSESDGKLLACTLK